MKKSDPPKYMVRKVLDNDRQGEYWSWEVYNSNNVVVARWFSHEDAADYAKHWNANEGRS